MVRLARAFLAYTESERNIARRAWPWATVTVAPNSLYPPTPLDIPDQFGTDICYVGRLVATKRPALLVQAFIDCLQELPERVRLHIVGSGPEERCLRSLISHKISYRIVFHGEVNDYVKLRKIYDQSCLCVSPGYVGLSLIQSLWFGVPMLIADSEPHAPEIAAAGNGAVIYFRSRSAKDLRRALLDYICSQAPRVDRRHEIARDCRSRYNTELMVTGFLDAIRSIS
jgi:glycosyltransferase involved in cell wall biosynthesis